MTSLPAVLVAVLLSVPSAIECLHCVAHAHCGRNAVCVTTLGERNPKCKCLLGYEGSGAHCAKSGEQRPRAKTFSSAGDRQQRRIVIDRCDGEGKAPPPPTPSAVHDDGHHEHGHGEHDGHAVDALPSPPHQRTVRPVVLVDAPRVSTGQSAFVFGADVADVRIADQGLEAAKLGRSAALPCVEAECDFELGPCSYRNDKQSDWQMKLAGRNSVVALVVGYRSTPHYLHSAKFSLSRHALLRFDYYDSSATIDANSAAWSVFDAAAARERRRRHGGTGGGLPVLRLCDRRLENTVWKSAGDEAGGDGATLRVSDAGWSSAAVVLAPGVHQLIFAAENLAFTRAVAVDNVRLRDIAGGRVLCE